MRFVPLDERAVSTVIGFLLIFSAVVSMTGYLVATKGRVAQRRAEGLVDVMDKAQQRQGQLVGLSYSNQPDDAPDNLHVYLSNYGWQDVAIAENVPKNSDNMGLWVNGVQISDKKDISIVDPVTDNNYGEDIPRREYVCVKVDLTDYPPSSGNTFTFLTKTDIVFTWEVHP